MRSLVLISLTLSANLAQSQFWFFNSSPSIPFQPAAGQRCAGRNFPGGKRCCSPEQPCGEGEGDCDGPGDGGQHDGHAGCKGDLVCGSNNCRQFGRFYHERDDCCEKPSSQDTELINTYVPDTPLTPPPGQRCKGRNYEGGRRCCTPQTPCDEGEGDCDGPGDGGQHDGNAGCKGDLVCGSNNCRNFGAYYHEKDDCCEKPAPTSTEPPKRSNPLMLAPAIKETVMITLKEPFQRCKGRNFFPRPCCTPENPCPEGQGDCEIDGDCAGTLVCGNNNCKQFGSFFHPKDDCCVKPEPVSLPQKTRTCKGRNFFPRPCCTPENPCPEGQGDCEIDGDCSGTLVCGNNNCKQFGSFFHEKDDCCVKPEPISVPQRTRTCKGRNFLPRPCCTPENPCPEGQGDCEIDGDCSGSLVCGNNNCKQFGSFFHEKDDCCVKPPERTAPVPVSSSVALEPPAGQRCAGRNYGGRRCCTPENPCQEGEGDCDGPDDGGAHDGHRGCAGGLVCGTNNCLQFGLYYHPKDDCCERPTSRPKPPPAPSAPVAGVWQEPPPGEKCSGRNYQGRRCCTPESPCDVGQGDCDGPADGGAHDGHRGCRAGLVCGSNNCRKFGAYFHEKDDCCEHPSGAGGWGQWGEFGSCSAGCGGGKWERQRYCKGPGCRHSTQSQQRICNTQPCSAPSQSHIEYPAPSAPSYCGNSYQPVCDTRGQTHDNNCEAQAAGAVVQCQGRCPCKQRPACPQETCAAGYSGYGDHCYKFINEALSWSEARARCVAEQSDLASVHSRPENEFLRQLSRGERLWLGGRRARRTRDFTWSDGSAWDWDNWDQGEPNNYFQDEDCLELYTQRAAWNDDHCSLFASPFVCKQGRVCRGSVDCGDHRAGSCSSCPWDPDSKRNYGAQWCQGDCVWRYGACGPRY